MRQEGCDLLWALWPSYKNGVTYSPINTDFNEGSLLFDFFIKGQIPYRMLVYKKTTPGR